jgi:hypothetical protein
LEPRQEQGLLGLAVLDDWSDDERPIWTVSLRYRRPDGHDGDIPHEAAERISSELRKTGKTRHIHVTVDADGDGYGLSFHLRASNHAQAEAAAESIASTCLDMVGMPFSRNISARSATRYEAFAKTSR